MITVISHSLCGHAANNLKHFFGVTQILYGLNISVLLGIKTHLSLNLTDYLQ